MNRGVYLLTRQAAYSSSGRLGSEWLYEYGVQGNAVSEKTIYYAASGSSEILKDGDFDGYAGHASGPDYDLYLFPFAGDDAARNEVIANGGDFYIGSIRLFYEFDAAGNPVRVTTYRYDGTVSGIGILEWQLLDAS